MRYEPQAGRVQLADLNIFFELCKPLSKGKLLLRWGGVPGCLESSQPAAAAHKLACVPPGEGGLWKPCAIPGQVLCALPCLAN